jgi:hypothetical protein
MSKGNTFENDLLLLVFNATPIAGIADNAASGALTDLYVSLHTGNPGEGGDQTTSECTYSGYSRKAVARSSGGFTVSGNSVSPVADIVFGSCVSGSETATYGAIGTDASGTGKIIYSGALSPTIAISAGYIPKIVTGSTITED